MLAPDVSVVILCYRAEDFVPVFISEMKAALEKPARPLALRSTPRPARGCENVVRVQRAARALQRRDHARLPTVNAALTGAARVDVQ
jgi:hypothetical protein